MKSLINKFIIALEMTSKLIDRKNKVIILEMLDEIGRGMKMLEMAFTLKKPFR